MSDWIQSADGTETIREDHDAVIRRQGDEIKRLCALVDSECRRAEEAHGESQRASLEIERLRAAMQALLLRYELDTDWDTRNENAITAAKAALTTPSRGTNVEEKTETK
jgi:hypothetical protein